MIALYDQQFEFSILFTYINVDCEHKSMFTNLLSEQISTNSAQTLLRNTRMNLIGSHTLSKNA